MKNKKIISVAVFLVLIILAVSSRTTNHLWNLTAVGGASLFAGAYFAKKWVAVLVPMLALLISDWMIGFDRQSISVYLAYAVIVALGFYLQIYSARAKVLGFSILGAVLFFLITNFTFWYAESLYPHNFAGLMQSYAMGLPFLRNQLLGDVGFTFVLFELAKALKLPVAQLAKNQI